MDVVSSFVMFIPIADRSAKVLEETFLAQWVCHWTFPSLVHCDREGSFISDSFTQFLHSHGCQIQYSTSHDKAQNGRIERKLRFLKEQLKVCEQMFFKVRYDWTIFARIAQLKYNCGFVKSLGHSPYTLMTGLLPNSIITAASGQDSLKYEDWNEALNLLFRSREKEVSEDWLRHRAEESKQLLLGDVVYKKPVSLRKFAKPLGPF